MKLFALLISFTFLFFSCNSNNNRSFEKKKPESDWSLLKLKANVKVLTEISHFESGKSQPGKKGSFIEHTKCVFNNNGYITEKYRYNAAGNVLIKTINTYDTNGNLTKKVRYSSIDSLLTKTIFSYDNKGNNIEENEYNSDGSLWQRRIFKYNDQGNLIERYRYDLYGSLLAKKTIFKYDEKGNKTEETRYNEDKSLLASHTYKYDKKGNVIENAEYCSNEINGKFNQLTYKSVYDNKSNKITEKKYDSEDILLSTSIYKYNEKDDLVGFKKFKPDGKIIIEWTQALEYDKKNNFIKLTRYEDSVAKFMIEREIEYY